MLPPKGHEGNPTELFQRNVQANMKKWRTPGQSRYESGPRNFYEAQQAVSDALGRLQFNINAFQGWYAARATGRHLTSRWENDRVAKRVLTRRQSGDAQVFQWPRKLKKCLFCNPDKFHLSTSPNKTKNAEFVQQSEPNNKLVRCVTCAF